MRQFRIIDNRDHQYLFAWYGICGMEIEGFSVPEYIYEFIDENGKLCYECSYSNRMDEIAEFAGEDHTGQSTAFITKTLTYGMLLDYFRNACDDMPAEEVVKAGTFISENDFVKSMILLKKAFELEVDNDKWNKFFLRKAKDINKDIDRLYEAGFR